MTLFCEATDEDVVAVMARLVAEDEETVSWRSKYLCLSSCPAHMRPWPRGRRDS